MAMVQTGKGSNLVVATVQFGKGSFRWLLYRSCDYGGFAKGRGWPRGGSERGLVKWRMEDLLEVPVSKCKA